MTACGMTNDQIPMTNKIPMTNDQRRHRTWTLDIGHWSFVGHWCLVIGHFALVALIISSAGCERGQSPLSTTAKSPRVASLVPAATDLLVAMGASDHLVAVSSWDQAIPEVRNLP